MHLAGDFSGTPLAAIDWGTSIDLSDELADRILTVGFVPAKEKVPYENREIVTEKWTHFEKKQALLALETYQEIIGFDVRIVDYETAEFRLAKGPIGSLGIFDPPGERNEGLGVFRTEHLDYERGGPLTPGSNNFTTLLHEFGHGFGLAHPHDHGGTSEVMRGVAEGREGWRDSGYLGLNQGIFTTMTYNDGWPDGPSGRSPTPDWGFQKTPMAFDIAVLQAKYGANMEHAAGNDVYRLPDVNTFRMGGTGYASIWDAGGTDTIEYIGARNVTIDLRAATLGYEEGGGGFVSYAEGVHGGYTIAHGVVIENATGGDGNDRITGNAADNDLDGGGGRDFVRGAAGDDTLRGGGDNDTLRGGGGHDTLRGGTGSDRLSGGRGDDVLIGVGGDSVRDFGQNQRNLLTGGDGSDIFALEVDPSTKLFLDTKASFTTVIEDFSVGDRLGLTDGLAWNDLEIGQTGSDTSISYEDNVIALIKDTDVDELSMDSFININDATYFDENEGDDEIGGGADADYVAGGAGNDVVAGRAGDDVIYGGRGSDQLSGGPGNDLVAGDEGADRVHGGSGDDTLLGGLDNDILAGNGGADLVRGGDGDDKLYGGPGNDTLAGNAGADRIEGGGGDDTLFGGPGNDTLAGNAGADRVEGSGGDDTLFGGPGDDTLAGNAGADQIFGGNGNDRIFGGRGDDILAGQKGNDALTGGPGSDVFAIGLDEGVDTIADFGATDLIGLRDGLQFSDLLLFTVGADTAILAEWQVPAMVRGIVALQLSEADFVLV